MTEQAAGQGRLYCAGWAVWDVRLKGETFPPTSARTRVLERREDVGGPATVAALAAASLGIPARLIAHTGGDAGEKIRARLPALGGQALLGATPDFTTPVYTVLVAPDGERFIFREALPEPAVPAELPRLGAQDVLLLDCRAPRLASSWPARPTPSGRGWCWTLTATNLKPGNWPNSAAM